MAFRMLVINPGATSTKIAVFKDERAFLQELIEHDSAELASFCGLPEQEPYRKKLILDVLKRADVEPTSFDAIAGRGGLLVPMPGGTYEVCPNMLATLRESRHGEHASNLGALLAYDFALLAGCKAYIVDPVSTDEFDPVARISGLPEIQRPSRYHALNHKAVARRFASSQGRSYADMRLIVAHLGTGTSVAAHIGGKSIDVNDPLNEGTFSVDRAGSLPVREFMELCYSGKYDRREMTKKIGQEGGLFAYIGTKDLRRAWEMADGGDEEARMAIEAMAYQIAKDIGSMAAVCCGKVDNIILTGGMAYSERFVALIEERVSFIAPVRIMPGEEELTSLAMGVLRVLRKEENALTYPECG